MRWIGLGVVLLGLFLVGRFLSPTPSNGLMESESAAEMRAEKDAYMRDDPRSPFNFEKHPVAFTPLKYFKLSQTWVFRSALTVFEEPEAVVIFDTKGRERNGHVFGYLGFSKENAEHRVRVYRMPYDGGFYYGLWFTDRTTGEATYEVGRYLNFELSEDPGHIYTIDFNQAYNPYCAYSPAFGCAIPRKEDFIDLAITAGEKRWHD